MIARSAILLVPVLAAGCQSAQAPLPEPVVKWETAAPTVTPIPAPDPICLPHKGRASALQPLKVHDEHVLFPKRDIPTRFINPTWIAEAEISADGTPENVRVVRPMRVDPPWPELQQACVSAMRRWRYEPTCVDGHPVRAILRVSGRLEFR
jgi:hypothetical protein